MINSRLAQLPENPFSRLNALLEGVSPGTSPLGQGKTLSLALGEPQHKAPAAVAEILAREAEGWTKYPPLAGTEEFRAAVAAWAGRRFHLPDGLLDPALAVLPVAGTREALSQVAQAAVEAAGADGAAPLVLLPNPAYQVYAGAGVLAGALCHFVPAGPATGFLPNYASLSTDLLDRAALAYFCTPSNPQGAVATESQLAEAILLARRHGFILAVDECYSEIYDIVPPTGALDICAKLERPASGDPFENVVVFHSLSKRSSVPGLRSGFVAGDRRIVAAFKRLRGCGGVAVPGPVLAASIWLWGDEAHVEENRALYRAKFDIAEEILAGHFGFVRPKGGFFLWLDVGDGAAAALALWREAGIRVLPGAYLAPRGAEAPGRPYIRVALVQDPETTRKALLRLKAVLTEGA